MGGKSCRLRKGIKFILYQSIHYTGFLREFANPGKTKRIISFRKYKGPQRQCCNPQAYKSSLYVSYLETCSLF